MIGRIYKITCDETNTVYYGSTISKLYNRLSQHKCVKNCMVKNMTNPKIFLIEEREFIDRKEMVLLEKEYIINNDCINKVIPFRTRTEWRKQPQVKLKDKEYNDMYLEKNREKFKEKTKCVCGSVFRKRETSKHIKTKKHLSFFN